MSTKVDRGLQAHYTDILRDERISEKEKLILAQMKEAYESYPESKITVIEAGISGVKCGYDVTNGYDNLRGKGRINRHRSATAALKNKKT